MIEKCCIIACKVLWREINFLVSKSAFNYDVIYLEQGLHNEPDKLRSELQDKITEIEKKYEYILIGYGLCSNGIAGISSTCATLVIMRGHDCITFFLGTKERYREYFDKFPGTYWYNTGWIETGETPSKEYYERHYKEYVDKYDEESAEFLIESEMEWLTKYNTVSYINQNIIDEKKYIELSKEAANYLNWQYRELEGSLVLLKDWIDGNWDDERFLILLPGEVIAPSFCENTIIKKQD